MALLAAVVVQAQYYIARVTGLGTDHVNDNIPYTWCGQ